jgi:hypothetical protein
MDRIVLDGRNDIEAGLLEPKSEATGAGKQVDADGAELRRHALRVLSP